MIAPDRRRLRWIVGCYLALGAVWSGVAVWVAPRIIASAYEGTSLSIFNRVLAGNRHPLEHYFSLWRSFAGAIVLGGLLHLGMVLVIRAAGRAIGGLSLFSAAFLGFAVLSGPRQDYVAYLEIWETIRRGGDPWWIHPVWGYSTNAYGPLFNALAGLAWINPLAPKLAFAFAYLWLVVRMVRAVGASKLGVAVWLLNPWPWVEIAYFGHFDLLIGLACIAAVRDRRAGHDVRSGVWLGVGVLFKYLPIVVLPFLLLDGRRIRPRLFLSTASTVSLGLISSAWIWGTSTFRPILSAASRDSTLLSIFRFLRGTFSPLRWIWDRPNVDPWAIPCLVVVGAAVFGLYVVRRIDVGRASAAAVLATLLFYRVGFPQYQMVLFLLVSYNAVRDAAPALRFTSPAWAYFGWLAGFNLFYAAIGGVIHPGDPWQRVEEWVGLPTFLLGVLLLFDLIRKPR